MASWIEELFPPTFKINDLFDNDGTKPIRPRSDESFQQVYEKVFEEMFSTRKDKEASEHGQGQAGERELAKPKGNEHIRFSKMISKLRQQECHTKILKLDNSTSLVGSNVAAEACQVDNPKKVYEEKRSEDTEDKCIWSAEELKVLRKSLRCSKLNNIRLGVLTQALQKDCERVRNTCHEQASEILKLNRKYNDVRKQNRAMKITCKAFKEDAKNLQENLEICQGRLEDAIKDKKSAELELVKIKHELEVVRKQNKVLQLELEKQKSLQEKLLENQNISLRSLYEKEITDLLERLEETEVCLGKEKNEHTITKKALVHLRLHFSGEGS